MSYKVIPLPPFIKALKKLVKKYPSLKAEYAKLIEQLAQQPGSGTPIGNSCYKIRIGIASANKGKRSGARVITHFFVEGETVYLLTIYVKNEQDDISVAELSELIKLVSEIMRQDGDSSE